MQRKLVRVNRELECKQATIERLINTDPLTGIANRRRFDEAITAEIRRNRRFGRPLSLIMADIDHFKRVNDTYGHTVGDEVLKRFAQAIGSQTRTTDLAARYGGEEFAIVLPETRLEESVACAKKDSKVI